MTKNMADAVRSTNATAATWSVDNEDWLVLQPLWNVVLANNYYTASPLFLVLVADGFYFVCMIPYIFLDFYGLDHWDWVKRYAHHHYHCQHHRTFVMRPLRVEHRSLASSAMGHWGMCTPGCEFNS